jgi:hypothetical protein
MCNFLNFAKFELNQKIWKIIQGQRAESSMWAICTVYGGLLAQPRAWPIDRRRHAIHGEFDAGTAHVKTGEGRRPEQRRWWSAGFRRRPSARWVGNGGYGNMATWGTRLRHLEEEWLTGRPCPQWHSRGGGAHWRPAGEAAKEGGQPIREVAGVHAVLGDVPVGPGEGRIDLSTWIASAAVGVDGGR